MKRTIAAVVGCIALAGLAGCTAAQTDEAAAAEPKRTAEPTVEPAASAPAEAPAHCQTPSKTLLGNIADGLEGDGVTVARGAAVKSGDFEKVWLVAVQLAGPGMDKAGPAVFATNGLDGTGLLMAVGGMANEFSVYPDASKTDAGITPSADGYDEAIDCLDASS